MNRLKAALDPRSVAIIGASENPNKVGGRPVHYLDKFGFRGSIFPINPSRGEVQATNVTGASTICRKRPRW
jgi:acyl-CoA synthetase (NDP forming)